MNPSIRCLITSLSLLFAITVDLYSDDTGDLKQGVSTQPFVSPGAPPPTNPNQWQLKNALCLGEFKADSVSNALNTSFIDETSVAPVEGTQTAGITWISVSNPVIFRAAALKLEDGGPYFAVYFSYWIYTPTTITSDQNLGMSYLACDKVKLFVNGIEITPGSSALGSDLRLGGTFSGLELHKGWNHFLVKLAGCQTNAPGVHQAASLIVYIGCADPDLLSKLSSAIAVKPDTSTSDATMLK